MVREAGGSVSFVARIACGMAANARGAPRAFEAASTLESLI